MKMVVLMTMCVGFFSCGKFKTPEEAVKYLTGKTFSGKNHEEMYYCRVNFDTEKDCTVSATLPNQTGWIFTDECTYSVVKKDGDMQVVINGSRGIFYFNLSTLVFDGNVKMIEGVKIPWE